MIGPSLAGSDWGIISTAWMGKVNILNPKSTAGPHEQEQLELLNIVSKEAEMHLKTTGASFLGSVLLQEKRASILNFELLRVVGKGSFGKVILARHKRSEEIYAIKVMDKELIVQQDAVERIMSEHNVLLGNEAHPFLVGLHFSFQSPQKLYFVLDYVNGGELYFHLNRDRNFAVGRSRFYAAELTLGLGFLHGLNVLYRDLKPENILLDQYGHVILTDFGLCKTGLKPGKTTDTFCGTPGSMAPEIYSRVPYGFAVDYWALGVVTYKMLAGQAPFHSPTQDQQELADAILHKEPVLPSLYFSRAASDFVTALLVKDPALRLASASELVAHEFFEAGGGVIRSKAAIDFDRLRSVCPRTWCTLVPPTLLLHPSATLLLHPRTALVPPYCQDALTG